jgi:organic radical activating enzyme
MAVKIRNAITQIYGTVQGEGLYIGEPQIFLRMYGCEIGCLYCDTPDTLFDPGVAQVELEPNSDKFTEYKNPLSKEEVLNICNTITKNLPTKVISITGGEPLESIDYLYDILEYIKSKSDYLILLETGGLHYSALETILNYVDIISMDIKLHSSSGLINPIPAHTKFIDVIRRYNKLDSLYVKIIVNEKTNMEEMDRILKMVPDNVPMVLQPETNAKGLVDDKVFENTFNLYKYMLKSLRKILLIPQMHKFLNVK